MSENAAIDHQRRAKRPVTRSRAAGKGDGGRPANQAAASSFLVALIAVLFLGGGCADRPSVTLKVSNWAGPEEIAIEEANLDQFRQRHPDVRLILEPVPRPGEYKQKILTSIAGGTAPDVFLLDAVHVAEFIQANVLLDLAPFAVRHGLELSQFFPRVLAIAQRDNALFALPKDFTPLVIYYNKNLFDAATLAYPDSGWTWDDLLKLARHFVQQERQEGRSDRYGISAPAEFFAWPPWVWSNGGDFLDPAGRRATGFLDSEATVDALQFLLDLSIRHRVAPDHRMLESMGGDLGMFLSGRLAMAVSGHWWMPQIEDELAAGRLSVGIAPIPTPRDGRHITALYAAGWAVWSGTAHPELAVELAIHLSSESANRRRAAQGVAIPAHRSLAEELIAQDESGLSEAFFAEIPFAREPWGATVAHAGIVEKYAVEAFAAALLQERDLADMLRQAAQQIDLELAARKP